MEANKYFPIWNKYKPVILLCLKNAIQGIQSYQMSEHEFTSLGDREKSGYAFNLELKNGVVFNNIDGSAVARDLYSVLSQSSSAKVHLSNSYYKIRLDTHFKLFISKL